MIPHRYIANILLLTLLLIIPTTLTARAENKHRIDVWLEQELSKDDHSTASMREAINTAREMWDREMNESYKRLMVKLPADKRTMLRNAQRAWIAFRDSDGEVISSIVSSLDGTMYQLMGTDLGYQRVRDRALQLIGYENIIDE